MEMSVFELLAIARESAGADYVKGDRILCGKRYAADTEHMLEFRVLSGQEPHVVFPSGLAVYDYEPYTTQNVLQYSGKYYVCGTGRQALMKDKTANDNYYLLTMAALAQEIRHRKAEKQLEVVLAAGLPLSGFGREKQAFYHYLLRDHQPLCFQYDDEKYRLWIRDVKLFRHCAAPGVCGRGAICPAGRYRGLDGRPDAAGQCCSQRGHLPEPGAGGDPLHG